MAETTLSALVTEVAQALAPLPQALASPTQMRQLLAALGWELPPAVSDIGLAASAIDDLLTATLALVRSTDAEWDTEVLIAERVGKVVAEIANVIQAMTTAMNGLASNAALPANYLTATHMDTELVQRLLDFLIVTHLERHHDVLYQLLKIAGIVLIRPMSAVAAIYQTAHARLTLNFGVIGALLSPSRSWPREVYGWGTPDADIPALMMNFSEVLGAIGASPVFGQLSRPLEEAIAGHPVPEAVTAPMPALSLTLLQGIEPDTYRIGLVFIEMRQSAPTVADAGVGVLPFVSGTTEVRFPLPMASGRWAIALDATADLTGGIVLSWRPNTRIDVQSGLFSAAAARLLTGNVALYLQYTVPTTDTAALFTFPGGTSFRLQGFKVGGGAQLAANGTIDAFGEAHLEGGKLTLSLGGADGFIASLISANSLDVDMSLSMLYSQTHGLKFAASAGIETAIAVNVAIGPFQIDTLHVAIKTMPTGLAVEASLDGNGAIGPVSISVERIGAALDLKFTSGNLGPLDFAIGFKPPSGAGLTIKAGPVTGGGYLFFDPDNEQYAGVLQLSFKALNLTAIGLLTTRLPDATGAPDGDKKGFSLLVIITADFPPIQIGFGFSLNGVGGLLGVNRTMVVGTLRAGVKNRAVESILFPKDPVARAPQIISDLRSIFPPAEGRYVFGPMVKIGWGPNSILEIEAALVLELMAPIRLVILGKIQVALPDKKEPVLQLRLDIVGVIDFGQCEASVDASLVDSKLAKFALTGDMAMRVAWGATKTFVLAAGGFNRRFQPPVGFPPLERLAISLADSDNPRLRLGAYLALTSNTIQFGAELDIYVKAETIVGVFTVSAIVTFDALIQYQPILFIADLSAAIDIARDGKPFLHAALAASLSGPTPWHAIGYVEFDCFGRHRIDVEVTVGLPFEPPQLRITPLEIAKELVAAISRADTWSALPPADGGKLVSLRDAPVTAPKTGAPPVAPTIAVHPLGLLTIRQRVLPLGKTITRLGEATVDPVSFTLEGVSIGTLPTAPLEEVRDDFAPGQYEALNDDQKLARPAFESMRSGADVRTTTARLPADATAGVAAQIGYEEVVIDAEATAGKRVSRPLNVKPPRRGAKRPSLPPSVIAGLVHGGAAAHAQTRAGGSDEFAGTRRLVRVRGERYVAANADTLSTIAGLPGGASYAEAREQASAASSTGVPLEVALIHEAA